MNRAPAPRLPLRSILRVAPEAFDPLGPAMRADAVMLDLAGATEPGRRAAARALSAPRGTGPALLVRVSDLDDGGADELASIASARPDAVVLTRAETGAHLQHAGALLAVEEAKAGLEDGAIALVAVAESAAALFDLIRFAPASRRLVALGWDAEALAADFGGEAAREDDGRFTDPVQTARTLALAAAADAGLPAIDTPHSARDLAAFRREAELARRDGFAGKVALSEAQAAVLTEVFAR